MEPERPHGPEEMMEPMGIEKIRKKLDGKIIHVIPYMHPDWAWCHTRIWHEIRYCSSIQDNIMLLEQMPEYRFYLDCWRTVMVPFLERCPEMVPALQRAVAAGKIAICGAYSNVRPNMVDGEAFIRNQIIGRRCWRDLFPDVDITVHADAVDVAMGHPQMPQLLAKSGYAYYRAGRPFELLWRRGIPRHFQWKGLDGSTILFWGGIYAGITFEANVKSIFVDDWAESVEKMYDLEFSAVANTATSRNLAIHQGCDDTLPLSVFNGNRHIPLPEFMQKWNRCETSTMRFSTPDEFFHALSEEPVVTVEGTLDPCDVSYNVAWGGERGIVADRIQGGELLSAAERLMACGCLLGVESWQDTTEFWKDNLTASAHATQWLYECDIGEIIETARRPIEFAHKLLQRSAKAILTRIPIPKNTVMTAFNPYGKDVSAPLVFTVPCGEIDQLQLVDGMGEALPFQVVHSYDLAGSTWEHDVALELRIPAHGWNSIIAASGRIDCRIHGESASRNNPQVLRFADKRGFSIDNGRLHLDFYDGDLMKICDMSVGRAVGTSSSVPWNRVSYLHIDTMKGFLHCGPIVERLHVHWDRFSIVENGPVRWLVRLWGSIGARSFTQDIAVHAGDNRIYYSTETQLDDSLEGYLTFGIPCRGDTLYGGINFGQEKKNVLEETYFAHDAPDLDVHRLRDGLICAKDFVYSDDAGHRIMLAPKMGDRYFLFDRNTGEIAYIHLGTTQIDEDSWERNVNRQMLHAEGKHRFEDMVVVDLAELPVSTMQNLAYANRMPPVLIRPVFHLDPSSPLGLSGSLLRVDAPNVQISAAMMETDELVVRIWEGIGKETETRLDLPRQVVHVQAEDFIGRVDPSARVSIEQGAVKATLHPWEIMTLRMETIEWNLHE
jgi:hypothetical protein